MKNAVVELLVPGLWRVPERSPDPVTPALLARMLGRGRLTESVSLGWEATTAGLLGFRKTTSGRRHWIALPVSLAAGLTDLVATPVVDLTPDEWDSLRTSVATEIEKAGANLQDAPPGLHILELEGEGAWEAAPPSTGLGRPMRIPRLDSPIARRLQVLGSTVQMLWFEHPVNQERVRTGRMPVHGLWFWSPGVPTETPTVQRVAGGGSLAKWLADAAGVAWSADPLDTRAELVVLEAFSVGRSMDQTGVLLESLCADLLAPHLARLRRGEWAEIRIDDPGVARLSLSKAEWRRFWRRPRLLASKGSGGFAGGALSILPGFATLGASPWN